MRVTGCFLVLIILATAGCMDPPIVPDEAASKQGSVIHKQETAHEQETGPAPVTASQVTESNAYEKSEALAAELSRAEAEEIQAKTTNP